MNIRHLPFTLILFALLISCSEQLEIKEEIRPVKFGLIEQAGGNQERSYSGITQSSSLTELSFRSGGLLMKLNAKVGQRVKKGKLLGQLDQKDAKLAYDQAVVDVQNAKAQFDAASSGFERVKQLYETNNASLSDYESAKSSYSSAQSSYEISLKRLELQKSNIDYTEIISPMDGIISSVQAEINEVVQAGRTVIVMSREDQSDLQVNVGLPERYINQIQNGNEVVVKIGSIKESFNGIVTEIAYTSSGTGVTYPVTIALDTKNNTGVRPDMPAEVTFSFGTREAKTFLIAPLKAVASGVGGNYVFTLSKTEKEGIYTTNKVEVELGEITSEGYMIRDGVKEGEMVAVAGLSSLYDGKTVKVLKD